VATFVIVHGAGGGGWEWRRVSDALRRDGHDVYAPTLTGLGERAHLLSPQIDLATHVTDVESVLRFEDLAGVVLVGHSYGGMVVMGVADRAPERIARLVCIDGFVPMAGQSSKELTDADFFEEVIGEPGRRAGDGWRVPGWAGEEMGEAYLARVRDHPLRTLTDPLVLEHGPPDLPGTYVQCTGPDKDPTFWAPSRANAEALGWDLRTFESPHDVAIAKPDELATLLADIAADV
jgi:pimeloyl-ACP methyl ester carboxylesterase